MRFRPSSFLLLTIVNAQSITDQSLTLIKISLNLNPSSPLTGELAPLFTMLLPPPTICIISNALKNSLLIKNNPESIDIELIKTSDIIGNIQTHLNAKNDDTLQIASNIDINGLVVQSDIFTAHPFSVFIQQFLIPENLTTQLPNQFTMQLNQILLSNAQIFYISLYGLTDTEKLLFMENAAILLKSDVYITTQDTDASHYQIDNDQSDDHVIIRKRLVSMDPTFNKTRYLTQEQCTNATQSCSAHGTCTLTLVGKEKVFKCKCKSQGTKIWTGEKCQYQDISPQFQIILLTVFGLVGVLIWGIGLLMSSGDFTSGINVGSGRIKQD